MIETLACPVSTGFPKLIFEKISKDTMQLITFIKLYYLNQKN